MRYIHIICIGLIVLLLGASAQADEVVVLQEYVSFHSGNGLLEKCKEALRDPVRDYHSAFYCRGRVEGIASTLSYAQVLCLPAKVNGDQLTKIIVKYLKANPQKLHGGEVEMAHVALSEAFPCKTVVPETPIAR